MMIARSQLRRPGFTLLEVLLATVISIMLLGAVYITFEMILKQADAGRTAVENGDLSRAIVNRMTLDLSGSLGPLPPKSGGGLPQDASSINSGTSSTPAATTPTTPATGTETPTTETPTTEITAPAETEAAADVPFQGGVFGSDKQLTLYVSRVPTDLVDVRAACLDTS